MTFQEIKTQEELEKILKERLEQKERSTKKLYDGYLSPTEIEEVKKGYQKQLDDLNAKYNGYESKVKEYESKIAKYETDSVKTEVAIELGIPLQLKDRLVGSTREEIEEDARKFSEFTKQQAPRFTSEANMTAQDVRTANIEQGYKDLVKNM